MRISVAIPLYNHERYIEQAVESVQRQTVPVDQIIVIDDGSTDGSARRAEQIAREQPNVIFWSHRNRGAHATINSALHRAEGDLVAILNSDDLFHPRRLEEVVGVFERQPDTDAVATSLSFVDDAGRTIANPWYEEACRFRDQVDDLALALVNGNFIMTTSNLVLRRRLLDEIGFFAALRYAHDLDFFLRVLAKGKTLRLIPKALVSYRTHATNTIKDDHAKVKLEWAIVVAFFLHCLWNRRDRGSVDWRRAQGFLGVLDRHGLVKPVLMLLTYFGEHPSDTLEGNPVLVDADFRRLLAEVVG